MSFSKTEKTKIWPAVAKFGCTAAQYIFRTTLTHRAGLDTLPLPFSQGPGPQYCDGDSLSLYIARENKIITLQKAYRVCFSPPRNTALCPAWTQAAQASCHLQSLQSNTWLLWLPFTGTGHCLGPGCPSLCALQSPPALLQVAGKVPPLVYAAT